MVRVLHVADLHLDRAFRGQSFTGCDGVRRRGLLRAALEWAVDEAIAREADLLTIGGDLFEAEHVTADTIAFVGRQLARLPGKALVISGNHDPAGPASPYRTATWPDNVTLSLEPRPAPLEVGEAVFWSLGYTGPEIDEGVLRGFQLPGRGERPNILVAHAVDLDRVSPEWRWGGLGLHASEVGRLGFDHALLGHIHAGQVGDLLSWPGSPVPLDPGEVNGNHGALWLEASRDRVTVAPVPASFCRFDVLSVDVTEISDSSELEDRVRRELVALSEPTSLATVRLVGRRRAGLGFEVAALADAVKDPVLGVQVLDETGPATDLAALAAEPNARGQAVARLLRVGSPEARLAAELLAEAFEGELRLPV